MLIMKWKAISRWRILRRRPSLPCLLVVILSTTFSICIFLVALEHKQNSHTQRNITLKEPQKIIILSYMRSGSTLTADIIQQHPGVFYVFEPLYSVEKIVRGFLSPLYLNKPSRILKLEYTPKINILKWFLTCSLKDVDLQTLHQHHMDKSKTTYKYNECLRNTSLLDFESKCLSVLTEKCRNSDYSMIKTIRFKMEAMEELLHLNQDLKVIHLIRDPRATLFSRAKLFQAGVQKYEALKYHVKQATTFCETVQRDLRDSFRLSKLYPQRVAILLYEKLIQKPRTMSAIMYDFLGLSFTNDIGNYVHNITEGGLPDNCPVCTTRKNATETANKWRNGYSFEDVTLIDQSCLALYHQLGYVTFQDSSELYDTSIPSWIEKPVTALLTDKDSLT